MGFGYYPPQGSPNSAGRKLVTGKPREDGTTSREDGAGGAQSPNDELEETAKEALQIAIGIQNLDSHSLRLRTTILTTIQQVMRCKERLLHCACACMQAVLPK